MKVLGATVLVMESLSLGFAILLATKDQSTAALIYGSVISLLLFSMPVFSSDVQVYISAPFCRFS